MFTDKHDKELPDDLLEVDTADEDLGYGSEFNDFIDKTARVTEESSLDTDYQSYNDIPSLQDIVKIKRDLNHMTPSRKVFDVTLPDTRSNNDTEYDNHDSPTKLDFIKAYDVDDIQHGSHEDKNIISNVKKPLRPP